MERIENIEKLLPCFDPGKKLKNEDKDELRKEIICLKDEGLNNEDVDYLIDKLAKPVNNKVKEKILGKTNKILFELKENNKKLVIISKITTQLKQSDKISEKEEIKIFDELQAVEEDLDRVIEQYNRYTEKNPMQGISYDKVNKKYVLTHQKKKLGSKKLEPLANKMLEIMQEKFSQKILKIYLAEKIAYKNKNILLYQSLNDPLFDIQHIIKLFDIEGNYYYKKYNDFKDRITHYGFKKNQYGGYVIKEFIPEKSMYELVLSSNSEFSKNFKKDVSEILAGLRQSGQLTIKNDKLVAIRDGKPNYNKNNICDETVKTYLNKTMNQEQSIQSYNNPIYCSLIKSLVNEGSKITIQQYAGKHIMYMFVITIQDALPTLNRIFIKIGYSADIVSRYRSLQEEYKCSFYLLGLKTIHSEQTEKEFHRNIRTTRNNLIFPILLNGKEKQELYVFDEQLYREFMAIKEYEDLNDYPGQIDQFIVQSIKDQYQYFIKFLNGVNSSDFYNCLIKIPDFTDAHKEVITTHITLSHNQNMNEIMCVDRDKQRKHEIEVKDKDIKLKQTELDIERIKFERIKFERIKFEQTKIEHNIK